MRVAVSLTWPARPALKWLHARTAQLTVHRQHLSSSLLITNTTELPIMSFDFGTRNESDPTSDFVSKFPDLDGAGGDDALLSSAAAAPAAASNNALDDDDLLGGGGSSTAAAAAAPAPAAAGPPAEEHSKEAFESNFPELDDPDLATPVEVEQPAATMQSTVSRCGLRAALR